jgi:hypothetical protein
MSCPRLRIPVQHTLKESSPRGLGCFRRVAGVGLVVGSPGFWAKENGEVERPGLGFCRSGSCRAGDSGRCGCDDGSSSPGLDGRNMRISNSGRTGLDYGRCCRGLDDIGAGCEHGALAQLADLWILWRWLPDARVATFWWVGLCILRRWLPGGEITEALWDRP